MKVFEDPSFFVGSSDIEKQLGLNFSLVLFKKCLITPKDAELLLTINYELNRKKVNSVFHKYADVMLEDGKWLITHEALCITNCGKMIDGQHRLKAIIESNKSQVMFICTGLGIEVYPAIDRGMSRKVYQVYNLNPTYSGVCSYIAGVVWGGGKADYQVYEVYEAISTILDDIFQGESFSGKVISSAPFIAAAVYSVLNGVSLDYVKKVFHQLKICVPGSGEAIEQPLLIRSMVAQIDEGSVSTSNSPRDVLARGMIVFDPSNINLKMVAVKGKMIEKDKNMLEAGGREAAVALKNIIYKCFGIGKGLYRDNGTLIKNIEISKEGVFSVKEENTNFGVDHI